MGQARRPLCLKVAIAFARAFGAVRAQGRDNHGSGHDRLRSGRVPRSLLDTFRTRIDDTYPYRRDPPALVLAVPAINPPKRKTPGTWTVPGVRSGHEGSDLEAGRFS